METKGKTLSSIFLSVLISSLTYGQWNENPKDFSDVTILNCPQLCSFTVKCIEGKTYVMWTTLDKDDNCVYVLESSADNITYHPLHIKKGVVSPNNIQLMHSYTDKNPMAGISYYRLKRLTTEGYRLSDTVTINNNDKSKNITESFSMVNERAETIFSKK